MKLRSITLTNVRRFAGQRLHVSGITDGITVLSQPNEFGKSTIFDAVHALFFERYGSRKQPLKSLQPHSAGAVSVSAEIETDAGLFEVSKQWLSKPMARVVAQPSGRVIAADDEAEAWIAEVIGGGTSGPVGLLWVRQDEPGLENAGRTPAEKNDREADRATRRLLLSEVLGGEIEAITGGRRMETVRAKAKDALDRLATATFKPKTGGPWASAETDAIALRDTATDLDQKVAALRNDLAARATAHKEMMSLTAPQADAERQAAYKEAKAALDEALGQAAQLAQAERALEVAVLAEKSASRDRADGQEAQARRGRAIAAQTEALEKTTAARVVAGKSRAGADKAGATLTEAEAAALGARAALETARKAETARRAAGEAAALAARVRQAQLHRTEAEKGRARMATLAIADADVVAAEQGAEEVRRLAAEVGAGAVMLMFEYDGALRADAGAGPVPAGTPVSIDRPMQVTLPGLGRMTVDPGDRAAADAGKALAAAEGRLQAALARCGARDLPGARQRQVDLARAAADVAQAEALLRSVAAEGLSALRAALAQAQALAAQIGGEPSDAAPPPVDDLDAHLRTAETALAAARGKAEALRSEAATSKADLAAAQATEAAAKQTLETATAPGDADLAALMERETGLVRAREAAAAGRDAVAAIAPNLGLATAAFDRTRGVVEQAQKSHARLTEAIARLDGSIAAQADLGVEEKLADTLGRLAAAEARAARFGTEARALRRLCEALDAARKGARDQFFAPILTELEPLLQLLHPHARLLLDDQSLLPVGLTRDGTEEPLDILSGGTREQIAILTRLAFARLYAKAGQALPIILDDALVHSDDERIVTMFDALRMVARDQQILVLTCRQRAFQGLGSAEADVQVTSA